MRRILSLPGLAVAVWASCLGFMGLLAIMLAVLAWHPHFLPMTSVLAITIIAGLALIVGASWRIVRGPGRREALSWLLLGSAPLWFLAGYFLYGLAVGTGRKIPLNLSIKLMVPLAESLMDLESRFRYPRRTAGEKVVMISPPMPEAESRAQVAAMDRHVRALEGRLGRTITGTVHWVRGPLLGMQGKAVFGLCLGSRPGEEPPDAEGLCSTDRHEVAHCVLTSHCTARFDPPAVLTEGWAEANQGTDPVEQAIRAWERMTQGGDLTLRQLTGPDWYNRHEWPAYLQGAPLVDFLLKTFGPERFLEFYATCSQSSFESDCRRILGLDLDGLDAAYRADIERRATERISAARRRLERLRLGPVVDADQWEAFLADYFVAVERLLAPYQHVRLTAVIKNSSTDAQGQKETSSWEIRLSRSGRFVGARARWPKRESACLANPSRSILADRDGPNAPWTVEDESKRTRDQTYHRALSRIDDFDVVRSTTAFLLALSEELFNRNHEGIVVTHFERTTEKGRPIVRVRLEDRSPPGWTLPWRVVTCTLDPDDLYVAKSVHAEGTHLPTGTRQSEFEYDRHDGIPVLHAAHTMTTPPDGSHGTTEMTITDRQFGLMPEDDFDPERFLDGPHVRKATALDPFADEPNLLLRWFWVPFAAGALCLVGGAGLRLGSWHRSHSFGSARVS